MTRLDNNSSLSCYVIRYLTNGLSESKLSFLFYNLHISRSGSLKYFCRIVLYILFHSASFFDPNFITLRQSVFLTCTYTDTLGIRRGAPKALGLQSSRVPNNAMTASSQWNRYHAPWLGRLKRPKRGRYAGAWCAKTNNRQQWLQVDFRGAKKIVAVATQGRHDYNQWVTLYYLSFSVDGIYFAIYVKNGKTKVSKTILRFLF